jgi:hypothetical protein
MFARLLESDAPCFDVCGSDMIANHRALIKENSLQEASISARSCVVGAGVQPSGCFLPGNLLHD